MKSLADLEECIRESLINNYWDINIYDYPDLIQEAKRLGLDERQLNQKVIEIDSSIDKRPYALIDKAMEEPISTGMVQDKDVRKAMEVLEGKLAEPVVVRYLINKIKRHRFEPRNRVPLDWSSFRNPWMTIEAWKKFQENHLEVEWLGEKARTLEEMGEISFRKKEDAQYYFRNSNTLPSLVTLITKNASKADGFSKIIDAEPDVEARYLNIVYCLNPSLPFRFRGEMFRSIGDLINAAFRSPEAFWALASMYSNRYIHIWLKEINADAKIHLTTERDTNGFLTFIYRLNSQYPFYLEQKRFDTPASLASEARINAGIWPEMATAIENGNLRTWFNGIGQQAWNTRLESDMSPIVKSELYSYDDKRLASVQTLIGIVDPTVNKPAVEGMPPAISSLTIEASKPMNLPVKVRMVNDGFLKMGISLDQHIEGVAIDRNAIGFYSQAGKTEELLHISIDPMKLTKGKTYRFNMLLVSVYNTTRIPVEIRAVFPKKAFLMHLVKYGVFGALFFGLISFLVQNLAISIPISTDTNYLDFDRDGWNLPPEYFVYIFPLVLLVGGLIFSVFLIRKIEKI